MWGQIVGGLVAGGLSLLGGSEANAANAREAARNRRFQERMSNTEMQRRTADLQKAGLNPMLAGMNQQGASAPSGSVAQFRDRLTPAVNSALSASLIRSQIQQTETQTEGVRLDNLIKAEVVPFSAFNARMNAAQVSANYTKTVNELQTIITQNDLQLADLENKRLTNAQLEKLQPLAVQLQQLEVQAKRLGMEDLSNMSEIAGSRAGGIMRWIRALRETLVGGGSFSIKE